MVELFAARRAARPFVADPELLALVVMSLVRASGIAWQRGGTSSFASRSTAIA